MPPTGTLGAAEEDAAGRGTEKHRPMNSRNSAIVQTGQARPGLYHKRQLGRPELSLFEPGTALPVFGVGDPVVGIQICREIIFPEPWQALKKQGAQLIVHVNNAIKRRDQF